MDIDTLPSSREINASLNERNFLGEGMNGRVYKIDNHPAFVIKISKHGNESHLAENTIPELVNLPELQGRNYGQPVATYGTSAELLLYQPGIPCGVPDHIIKELPYCRHSSKEEEYLNHYAAITSPAHIEKQEKADRLFETAVIQASNIPLKGYMNLLEDFRFLNANGMGLDWSRYGNLLIDGEAGQFRIVDLAFNDGTITINYPYDVAFMICRQSYLWQFYLGGNRNQIIANRRIVLDRTITACENLGLRFAGSWDLIQPDTSFRNTLAAMDYEEGSAEFKQIEERIALSASRPEIKPIPARVAA